MIALQATHRWIPARAGGSINAQDVIVSPHTKLVLHARQGITINGPFEVTLHSELEVENEP